MKRRGVLLAALAVALDAQAQLPSFDSDRERLAASLVFPVGRRDFIRKTAEFCGARFEEVRLPAQIAYAHWVRRHAGFLRMTDDMRRYLTAQAQKDSGPQGTQWKHLLGQTIPQQIEKLSSAATEALAGAPSDEARREMCRSTVVSIDRLKLDLDESDPEVAGYLRGVAAKNGIDVPPRGSDPTAGAPDARRDAAAMVGRWKTDRVLYYFADGTEKQTDGTCTLTFAPDRAESECNGLRGAYSVRYAFRASDSGRYDSQVVDNSANPKANGAQAGGLFRVEGKTLHISVFPLSAAADAKQPIEIESVAVRQEEEGK